MIHLEISSKKLENVTKEEGNDLGIFAEEKVNSGRQRENWILLKGWQ